MCLRYLSLYSVIPMAILLLICSSALATYEQKITPTDAADKDEFSRSVDISGDFILIGAPEDDDMGGGSGSAYIFHRESGSWIQNTKLTAPDGDSGDQFEYPDK